MHSPHVDARLRLDAAKVIDSVEATADKAEAERIATMLAAKYGLDDDLDEHRPAEHVEPRRRADPAKNP